MNVCSEAIKPSGTHAFMDVLALDKVFYHNPTIQNGTNGLSFGSMAAEELGQTDWYKNGHSHPPLGNSYNQYPFDLQITLSKHCQKEAHQDCVNPGQYHGKNKLTDYNNNPEKISELEAHVLNILSTNDQCSLYEIQKRLPAVTSPKVVEYAMDSLVSKRRVTTVNSSPKTWALISRYQCSESRNGFTNLFGKGGRHQAKEGKIYKSALSTSFQKQTASSYEEPGQITPECTRDDLSKRCSPRISSLDEEDLNSMSLSYGLLTMHHSQEIDYQEQIGGLSKSHRFLDGFDLLKNHDTGVSHDYFPSEKLRNTYRYKLERPPVAVCKPRRDPGVIGEERINKNNRRSQSLEETWLRRKHLIQNEYEKHDEGLRPRSRSFGTENDAKSCSLCRISFISQQQLEEHFQSTKHQNKMAKITSDPYPKFCDYCKVGLNSKSQAQEHFSSGRHEQTVAKSQKAPVQNHLPITTGSKDCQPLILTESKPQEYQVELYIKAMSSNSVCFLPTGAGNALVNALVVAHMLTLNPSRQVIFLVDRVLLVIQQSDYLKHELKNLKIPLSAKDNEQISRPRLCGEYQNHGLVGRPIRIGAICGEMRKLEPGIPVFSHDILVVTADCYRNHINNGTLRFEDSALIVLDESHHCNKDHPYNVIIRDYFLPDEIPDYDRPKILGLTSSPAGEPTLDRTVKKIQRLLSNLGGASLLPISHQILELTEKTSQADIVCSRVEYSPSEKILLGVLMEYCTKCFNLAGRVSGFKEYKDVFQPSSGGVLAKEDIGPVLEVIDKFSPHSKPRTKPFNSLLHFQAICEAICALQECGEKLAVDRLMELADCVCPYGFDWAMEQGLPCESLKLCMEECSTKVCRSISDIGSGFSALVELLIEQIDREHDERFTSEGFIAVVLVKRSQTAIELADYLDSCHTRLKGIRTRLMGCDASLSYQGIPRMQSKTLSSIREGLYQIAVTTYVEEERLDLPTSRLVIQLDPPNTVSALGQIRSRLRESQTTYAAICRDSGFPKKIKDLLLRESNMIQATQIITANCQAATTNSALAELMWMI